MIARLMGRRRSCGFLEFQISGTNNVQLPQETIGFAYEERERRLEEVPSPLSEEPIHKKMLHCHYISGAGKDKQTYLNLQVLQKHSKLRSKHFKYVRLTKLHYICFLWTTNRRSVST